MLKINYTLFILVALIGLTSCEKPEDLWMLPPAGEEKVITVEMGENYETTIFFRLQNATSHLQKYDVWDLGFSTQYDEFYITMNGGKGIQVYNTHDTDFAKTTFSATINSPWQWDNPNGHKDSTAFGKWCDANGVSSRETYIVDLGPLAMPRYRKMQLTSANEQVYHFRYANINNSDLTEAVITKDKSRNFSYYNLDLKTPVDFEPESEQWDLVFTKYRHIYYDMDPVTPYPVTGVLINTRYVTINETQTLKFEDIDYDMASGFLLTPKADEIGYDWKYFDLNGTGKYSINEKKIYIIKDSSGAYYKLKFIGFYNEQGLKGSPKFIYQRL